MLCDTEEAAHWLTVALSSCLDTDHTNIVIGLCRLLLPQGKTIAESNTKCEKNRSHDMVHKIAQKNFTQGAGSRIESIYYQLCRLYHKW